MTNYHRFMRHYMQVYNLNKFLDAVCLARDLYHANKHLSWAEQQTAIENDDGDGGDGDGDGDGDGGDGDGGDDGGDGDGGDEEDRRRVEEARRENERLRAERLRREDQDRRLAQRIVNEAEDRFTSEFQSKIRPKEDALHRRLNEIEELVNNPESRANLISTIRGRRLAAEQEVLRQQREQQLLGQQWAERQRLAQTANPLVRGFMARRSVAAEQASAQQARDLAIQQQREQDDVRRLALAASELRERDAMRGADVNAGVRASLKPARRERRFTVSFGSDIPARTQAAFSMLQGNDPDYETSTVLREIKAGITGRESGITNKEAEVNYFNKKGAGMGLYPYSILIVSREMDGTFVGFAVFHEIQARRDLSRSQFSKEKTDFEKKGIKPTFRYTGFGIDLMAARGGAGDIVEVIYRAGERLYGPEYIGLYLSAVTSAQPFYRKIGFVEVTPTRRDASGRVYAELESSKELYARRGQPTPERYEIVDKDTYNMVKPPGYRGGSMEGGANAYIDFMHEWMRVHGGTFACAYMNGIDLYYRTKLMTRADRNRAIQAWDDDVPDEVLAAAAPARIPRQSRAFRGTPGYMDDGLSSTDDEGAAGPSGNPVDFVAPSPAEAALARVAASEAQTRPLEPRPRHARVSDDDDVGYTGAGNTIFKRRVRPESGQERIRRQAEEAFQLRLDELDRERARTEAVFRANKQAERKQQAQRQANFIKRAADFGYVIKTFEDLERYNDKRVKMFKQYRDTHQRDINRGAIKFMKNDQDADEYNNWIGLEGYDENFRVLPNEPYQMRPVKLNSDRAAIAARAAADAEAQAAEAAEAATQMPDADAAAGIETSYID